MHWSIGAEVGSFTMPLFGCFRALARRSFAVALFWAMHTFCENDNLHDTDDVGSSKDVELVADEGFETSKSCEWLLAIGVSTVKEPFVMEGGIGKVDTMCCEGFNNLLEGPT